MSLRNFLCVVAFAFALSARAQDKGYWQAASNTAASITGDIVISDAKLSINFISYPLAHIRELQPAEVAAVFDADVNTAGKGTLYRLSIPAAQRFLHKNTLCGTERTQWMATWVSGKTLSVAFFSGDNTPVFTFEAVSSSMYLCGAYTFVH
jgi:hypothetical protein